MLPPFIIEQIRRREAEERKRSEVTQPRLELPLEEMVRPAPEADDDADSSRGVIVIDL